MNAAIDSGASLGPGVRLGHYVVIEAGAVIGAEVELGHHVVVHHGTEIGAGAWVADGAVLGRSPRPAATSSVQVPSDLAPLRIGARCIVGAGAVIYAGTTLGPNTLVGDQALIRDRCRIGSHVIVGSHATLENDVTVGDYSKLQTGVYLCGWCTVEDHCFLGPCVVTTNDNYMGRTERRLKERGGCTIRHGARVGANVTLLPNVEIGAEAFIAAASVVTRNVAPATVVMGAPAHPLRAVPGDEFLADM